MTQVKYRNTSFRVVLSIIASFVVIVMGHELDAIARLMTRPIFYIAWAISFVMTAGLIFIIHLVTVKLDKRYDWRLQPKKRGIMQAVFGATLPLCAEAAMIGGYSMVMDDNFDMKKYIIGDVPWIFLFIVLVNVYYAIHYLVLTTPQTVEPQTKDRPHDPAYLILRYGPETIHLDIEKDVLYFKRDGKSLKVITEQRSYYYGTKSIVQMENLYGSYNFCQINRTTMINMRIVQDSFKIKRDTLKIIFTDPHIVPDADGEDLWVKKGYLVKFKACFDQKTKYQHLQ